MRIPERAVKVKTAASCNVPELSATFKYIYPIVYDTLHKTMSSHSADNLTPCAYTFSSQKNRITARSLFFGAWGQRKKKHIAAPSDKRQRNGDDQISHNNRKVPCQHLCAHSAVGSTVETDINITRIISYLLSYVHYVTFTTLKMIGPVIDFT